MSPKTSTSPKKSSSADKTKAERLLITGEAQKQISVSTATKSSTPKTKTEKASSSKEEPVAKVTKKNSSSHNGTKIVVKCDCGFSNALFIRGEGIANLHWDKGMPLKNVKNDEWVWETDRPFVKAEFKILVNDNQYEIGENHKVNSGSTVVCHPIFS